MALYFYFNETTGDLVYSDKATYGADGYTSLGEQVDPSVATDWVFHSYRSGIRTVTKDPSLVGKASNGWATTSSMFQYCEALESVDLSGIDMSEVKNTAYMFDSCGSIESLDMSIMEDMRSLLLDNMACMFRSCTSLRHLDLGGFDPTHNIAPMSSNPPIFTNCVFDSIRCVPSVFFGPDADHPQSTTGEWVDYAGRPVDDPASMTTTATLYSNVSHAPDGSKLVNLQDLKAAFDAQDDVFPMPMGTVIAGGTEYDPATWSYGMQGMPGFYSVVDTRDLGSTVGIMNDPVKNLICFLLSVQTREADTGVRIGIDNTDPFLQFKSSGGSGKLHYKDGMPVLTSINGNTPIMAGTDPYGFTSFASDEDFAAYLGLNG